MEEPTADEILLGAQRISQDDGASIEDIFEYLDCSEEYMRIVEMFKKDAIE